MVRLLVGSNANVNAPDEHGQLPLIYAMDRDCDHEDVLRLLLDARADVSVWNQWGRSALVYATRRESPDLLHLLTRHEGTGCPPPVHRILAPNEDQ